MRQPIPTRLPVDANQPAAAPRPHPCCRLLLVPPPLKTARRVPRARGLAAPPRSAVLAALPARLQAQERARLLVRRPTPGHWRVGALVRCSTAAAPGACRCRPVRGQVYGRRVVSVGYSSNPCKPAVLDLLTRSMRSTLSSSSGVLALAIISCADTYTGLQQCGTRRQAWRCQHTAWPCRTQRRT